MDLLVARDVSFGFRNAEPLFRNLTLCVAPDERVALCAPSGAGKTTLCQILAGYREPIAGSVTVDGVPLRGRFHRRREPQPARSVQLVWQHPEQAFDPRRRIAASLREAGDVALDENMDLAQRFGIPSSWYSRYPHELSGGELMRCSLLRAIMARPQYLIADEATAMFDMVSQAQIWQELVAVADEMHMGMVFVSHSEALVGRVATRVIAL